MITKCAEAVAGVAALFSVRPTPPSASNPGATASPVGGAAAASTPASRPGTGRSGGVQAVSVRGSYSTVRSSSALSPAGGVVRTLYTPLSSEEEEEEDEFEARLLAKYGLGR